MSQQHPERTIDEIRVEAIHRAEVGQYPLIGLDPEDIREAFKSIHTRDKDEWAAGFMGVADRYMNEAKSLEKTDPGQSERRLHSRVAALFVRTLANPCVFRQAALVRKGNRGFPGACAILGSATGDRENSVRRKRDYRLLAFTEEC